MFHGTPQVSCEEHLLAAVALKVFRTVALSRHPLRGDSSWKSYSSSHPNVFRDFTHGAKANSEIASKGRTGRIGIEVRGQKGCRKFHKWAGVGGHAEMRRGVHQPARGTVARNVADQFLRTGEQSPAMVHEITTDRRLTRFTACVIPDRGHNNARNQNRLRAHTVVPYCPLHLSCARHTREGGWVEGGGGGGCHSQRTRSTKTLYRPPFAHGTMGIFRRGENIFFPYPPRFRFN